MLQLVIIDRSGKKLRCEKKIAWDILMHLYKEEQFPVSLKVGQPLIYSKVEVLLQSAKGVIFTNSQGTSFNRISSGILNHIFSKSLIIYPSN